MRLHGGAFLLEFNTKSRDAAFWAFILLKIYQKNNPILIISFSKSALVERSLQRFQLTCTVQKLYFHRTLWPAAALVLCLGALFRYSFFVLSTDHARRRKRCRSPQSFIHIHEKSLQHRVTWTRQKNSLTHFQTKVWNLLLFPDQKGAKPKAIGVRQI